MIYQVFISILSIQLDLAFAVLYFFIGVIKGNTQALYW